MDTPNLGFPYFNFLGGYQLKKHPVETEALHGASNISCLPCGEHCRLCSHLQGVFLHWASPKKLKYGKPRLGESMAT